MNRLIGTEEIYSVEFQDIPRKLPVPYMLFVEEILQGFLLMEGILYVREMSRMQERAKRFTEGISDKGHLMELVRKMNCGLEMETDTETVYLYFYNGKVTTDPDQQAAWRNVTIKGSKDAIARLLDGEMKLRDGVQAGDLRVSGSFRELLALESIFYLASPLAK
ncbi:SCP2 sterol-binding domain-containing protein [Bacillus sp. REN3]|uniref:SCP2 sterol-binding domain-containing protein n=1 Tax=Bacillus sp. REN3 TaxID=2802440 RepID=UPI001AEDEDC1|nr:SCP2 sterol-binding domain-containing protein [Bacillus sp. REN3]